MFNFKFDFWWNRDGPKERLKQVGKSAAQEAAEFVAARARSYAPIDTGALVQSITVTPTMNGFVWNVMVGVPYAGYVEYGSLHGGTWIPPNPFFRKAMQDGRKRFREVLRESMVTTPHQLGQGMRLGTTIRVTG